MNTPQETLRRSLREAFEKALAKVESQQLTIDDMYVRVKEDDEVTFVIYDDSDNELHTALLDSWEEWRATVEDENSAKAFATLLEETVKEPGLYEKFDRIDCSTPFSLILVDDHMEIVAEILTIDHENIVIDDDMWEKMDKELDEFFEKLMSDVTRK